MGFEFPNRHTAKKTGGQEPVTGANSRAAVGQRGERALL